MTNSKAPWLTRGGAIALMAAAAIALAACSGGGGLNEDEAAGLQQELKEAQAQATADAADRMTAETEAALAQTEKETAEAEATAARMDQVAAETALRLAEETAAGQVSDAEADVETARKEAKDAADAAEQARAALTVAQDRQKVAEDDRDAALAARDEAQRLLRLAEAARALAEQQGRDADAEQDRLAEDNEELRQEVNRVDARVAHVGLVDSVGTSAGTVAPATVKARYRGMTTLTTDPALTLRQSTAPSIGSPWSGTALSSTTSTHEDELVVYTNIGPATRVSIEVKHTAFTDTDDTDNKAIFKKDITTDADGQYIRGSGWPTSEGDSKTYETANYDDPTHDTDPGGMSNERNTVKVSGSYDGASGDFYCSGPPNCEVTRKGNIFVVPNDQWTFVTDASRTVSQDDESFMHFGWWRRMVVENGSLSFASFSGGTNGVSGGARTFTQVFGPVTYNGSAVGQYAIYQPLGGQSGAGSFTARARLTADFDDSNEPGTLSGEVTNFSNDSTWLVRLNSQTLTGDGALSAGATGWEIDGDHSTVAGVWSAQFYTEETFDGQTPDGVAGTFNAQFDSVGRLIGAFGARK